LYISIVINLSNPVLGIENQGVGGMKKIFRVTKSREFGSRPDWTEICLNPIKSSEYDKRHHAGFPAFSGNQFFGFGGIEIQVHEV